MGQTEWRLSVRSLRRERTRATHVCNRWVGGHFTERTVERNTLRGVNRIPLQPLFGDEAHAWRFICMRWKVWTADCSRLLLIGGMVLMSSDRKVSAGSRQSNFVEGGRLRIIDEPQTGRSLRSGYASGQTGLRDDRARILRRRTRQASLICGLPTCASALHGFGYVAVGYFCLVARRCEVLFQRLRDHHRTMVSSGAAKADRQIALAFVDIVRQQVDE